MTGNRARKPAFRLLVCCLALAVVSCATTAQATPPPSSGQAPAPGSGRPGTSGPEKPTGSRGGPPAATVPAAPAARPAATARASAFDPTSFTLVLRPVVRGLRQPLFVTHAGDGSQRLFVVEKGGVIRIAQVGALLPAPFLDVSSMVSTGSEQGLLGLAMHPRYRDNGYFFVNYTDQNGDTNVVRYQVSSDPNVADPQSSLQILKVKQPYANHNGGNLVFGPDGYLWIGLGDGGSGGDPQENGQNGQTLLGKMLRIDVDSASPYGIPPDNPFVNASGIRPEIWAVGLRNPWRYSFDRLTGDLYVGDVGQNTREEVNFQSASSRGGENYGWNVMEGSACFRTTSCDRTGLILPVAEYETRTGCAVTAGYVYRSSAYPALQGAYFFGDYCNGRIWSLVRNAEGSWTMTELLDTDVMISSFGEDEAGELYVTGLSDGVVYQVTTDLKPLARAGHLPVVLAGQVN